jgi:hypothetical protein
MADQDPSRSDLPAPYASPWAQLAVALRAVLASLRLKFRELWRRNAASELSVPGFWPQGLAALFWPLLLAVLLALAVQLGRILLHRSPGPPPSASGPGAVAIEALQTTEAPAEAPPPAAEPRSRPDTVAPAPSAPPMAPANSAPPPPPAAPPRLELDPLLALLADDDPDHLIASAHPEPAEVRLVLTMKAHYTTLSPASRRRWAERWQERALALGYRRLELVDADGRLLARGALVGSGMILLDPGPPIGWL